jgi:predicted nucleic acid-binding protein
MILVDSSIWIDYFRNADTPRLNSWMGCLAKLLLRWAI